jgi:addiction module RelB/DinJ family antitoxin
MLKTKQSQKTAVIQVRINKKDKIALQKTLAKLGLTTSQATHLYFQQILLKKRIPMEISLPNNEDENSQANFQKSQAKLLSKLDEGEIIPEFTDKNARGFV